MSSQGWSADTYLEGAPDKKKRSGSILMRLVVAAGLALALVFHGGNGQYFPLEYKWLGLALMAGGMLIAAGVHLWRSQGFKSDVVDYGALLFFAWAVASWFWSADPIGGVDTLMKLLLLFIVFVILRRYNDVILDRVIIGTVAGSAMLSMLIERGGIAAFGGYFNQNYQTEMLLATLPFMLYFHRIFGRPGLKWLSWGLGGLTVVYLLLLNQSKIEFVVIPAMLSSALLVMAWRKSWAISVTVGVAAVILFFALGWLGWESGFAGLTGAVKTSLLPRVEITTNTLLLWLERPLLGIGVGSFTAVYPLFQTAHRDLLPFDTGQGMLTGQNIILAQAHNDWAQLLAVFGLVGLLILLLTFFIAWRRGMIVLRDQPIVQAGGLLVVGICANALIDFPLQNAATALLAAIGFAWLLRVESAVQEGAGGLRASVPMRLVAILVALLAALPLFWGERLALAHVTFTQGVQNHYVRAEQAYRLYRQAESLYPPFIQFRAQIYMALQVWEEVAKARQPESEHDRAFAISLSTGPQTVVLMPRLAHLYNTGQYTGEEVERWRKLVTKNAPDVPQVWLQESLFELRNGNPEGVVAALARFERLEANPNTYTVSLVQNIRQEAAALRKP